MKVRLATLEDAPEIEALIAQSVHGLQASDYALEQREGALGTVFGVDRQLIRDGTYFVVEAERKIVGCGGWSRRATLFGGDNIADKNDASLDPTKDAARVRAFFVHPDWARRGIGSRILEACEAAAAEQDFRRLELVATLTGEPLYRARGFIATARYDVALPNGATLPVVAMMKTMDGPQSPTPPS
jgi:N-acetylglutamate synthase-like GNAT family acetyltransferase